MSIKTDGHSLQIKLSRSVLDYWVDISELKEEDKVSRVLTGLQIALSLQIETTETKGQKQGQERITLITLLSPI